MSPGLCSSSRDWPTIFHRATKGLGSSTTQSIEHTEALRPLFEGRTPSAQANEQAKAAQLIGHRSHSPVTVDIRSNTLACPQQQHPAAQRLQDMEGGDAGGCGAVDKAEPNVFQAQDTASRTSLLSQAAATDLDLRHHNPGLWILVQHPGDQIFQVFSYVRPGGDDSQR